jgi:hypothetical protein
LSESWKLVVKKLSKSCQKVSKKLAKSWQKGSKNSETENSETVRRRRGGEGDL